MTSIKQVFCWTRYMVWKKVREKITLWRRGISQRSWTSRSEAGNFSQAPSTCALEEAIHLENLSYSHQPPPHRCLPWFLLSGTSMLRLPRRLGGKECACQCRRQRVPSCVREIPWRRKWSPTPGFLPGKFRGQRRLENCRPWGCKWDTT